MTTYLTLEDVVVLGTRVMAVEHEQFIIRDVGLLQSALARPQMTVFGKDAYPTLTHKAAALMESLARNHSLVDGNKRLAWAATKLFLGLNGEHLYAPSPEQGEALVLSVATGSIETGELSAALNSWSH